MVGKYKTKFKKNNWPTYQWVVVYIKEGSRKHSSGQNGYVMDFQH